MFHFTEDYQLSNKKVALSPLAAEHFAPLFREADNEQIWKYFLENGLGKENFKVYFDQAIDNRKKGKEYPLVIKDKTRNAIAGMTRIYEVNNRLKIVKIGHTWIGKRFQGTGLNKNGKYLLFEFLFEEMGMERIGFGASAENIVSINALKSVGCQKEGVLRSFMPGIAGKTRVDIVLMSLLKKEWQDTIKEELYLKL